MWKLRGGGDSGHTDTPVPHFTLPCPQKLRPHRANHPNSRPGSCNSGLPPFHTFPWLLQKTPEVAFQLDGHLACYFPVGRPGRGSPIYFGVEGCGHSPDKREHGGGGGAAEGGTGSGLRGHGARSSRRWDIFGGGGWSGRNEMKVDVGLR